MTDFSQYLSVISFPNHEAFEHWLTKNHSSSPGIWIRLYKIKSGIPSITYHDAVKVALCYGWIDSQVKKYDDVSYIQKFGPRRSKSPWSQINKNHVERLIKEGKMKKPGLAAIEEAKKNGNWENAYGSPSTIKMPEEFKKALHANKKAQDFYETLNNTHRFYFLYWIISAKRPETKEKRIKLSIDMLAKQQKRM